MSRRVFVILLLAVILAFGAQGQQKRRAVRVPPPTPPPAGTCHTFANVRAGLVASYVTSPLTNYTVTYISDNGTRTVTHQKVTTSQGVADADTIIDGETANGLRTTKHVNVKTTTAVPFFGNLLVETDIDFSPSLPYGPAGGWCVGNSWVIPAITQTMLVKSPIAPPVNKVVTVTSSTGEILAVGENLTVQAGTFRTVKYKGIYVSGESVSPTITWMSMDLSIPVRQETYDPVTGALTTTVELVSVQ
jgi:hypothetical protein